MTTDRRAAPLREYENEDVFAWIRRQNNPVRATAVTSKKKEPLNAGATAPGSSTTPTKE